MVDLVDQVATLDITIDQDAECTEVSPCDYWPLSTYSQRQSDHYQMQQSQRYRIWQIQVPFEPLTVVASTSDETRLVEVQALVESLTFLDG